jgi:predicted PurR-regulated permease PerM
MQIKQNTFFWGALLLVTFFLLYLVNDILTPFIFGIVVAYFLDPFADRLESMGFSRNNSTIFVISFFIVIAIMLVLLLGPVLTNQFSNLMSDIPNSISELEAEYGPKIHAFIASILPNIEDQSKNFGSEFSSQLVSIISKIFKGMLSSGSAAINFVSLLVVSPIVAFYMLRDWDDIIKKLDELLPRYNLSSLRKEFSKIDNIISAYIRGQVSVALIMAVFYSVNLTLVGLNYGFAIGFLTGILSFVPYVGMAIGMISGLLVAYLQYGISDGLVLTFLVFLFGNVIEGNFITPKLVGEKVQLHPAWVIFALLAGGSLLGFTGVLIAIPVAAVIGVLVRTMLSKYKNSSYYLGSPIKALSPPDVEFEGTSYRGSNVDSASDDNGGKKSASDNNKSSEAVDSSKAKSKTAASKAKTKSGKQSADSKKSGIKRRKIES